ncbi:MAG: type II secretion system F family protein [Thermoplasmata archaeon]
MKLSTQVYEQMDLTFKQYLLFLVLPSIIAVIVLVFFQDLLFPPEFTEGFVPLITQYAIPAFIVTVVVLFPWISTRFKVENIESNLHLFVVHLEALSTSTVSNKEILRSSTEEEEYGDLTEEIKKMYNMMEHWDLPLAEAARTAAAKTPSEKFADFLTRLAHSQESGENLSYFLEKERSVVIKEYETTYKQSLDTIDLMQEALISMMISVLFMIMFLAILPLFSGESPMMLIFIGIFVFLIIEVVFFASTKTILPKDDMWHHLSRKPPVYENMMRAVPIVLVGCVVFTTVLILYTSIDIMFIASIGSTPLFFPGVVFYMKERDLRRCDENYDAFMRSVSSSAATSSGGIEAALSKIKTYEFGPLTKFIDELHKRLWTRIDEEKAWTFFASDTLSSLIARFTRIYVKSVKLGGDTKKVSEVISDTFVRMNSLRKERYQSASGMVGVLFGLQFGSALTLALTIYIAVMMDASLGMMVTLEEEVPSILVPVGYSIPILTLFVLILIILHAVFSSLVLTSVSGSHYFTSFMYMPPMIWVGVLTAYGVELMTRGLMP